MSDADEDRDNREVRAGEYVLGITSASQRREVLAQLGTDRSLRDAVDRWEDRLAPLTQLAAPIPPSRALWSRIERSIDVPPRAERDATAARGWWQSLPLWRGLATAGLVATMVLGGVLLTAPKAPTPQYLVVLVAPEDKTPGWVIQASTGRQINLIPLGVVALPADKALQFWTKADDWNAPVSLGLVRPGQTLTADLDRLPPLQPNQLFELTLEPATGSPTGRPTGPIQAIGRAVKVL